MRCLALATELKNKGAKIIFICKDLPGNFNKLVSDKSIDLLTIDGPASKTISYDNHLQLDDAKKTCSILKDFQPDLMIVDHYSFDHIWENRIKRLVPRIMVIDDLADRQHECEILLDQNDFNTDGSRYKDIVNESCKLLLGPKYVMLRDEFKPNLAASYELPEIIKKILLFFSLGNDQGETLKAMRGILQSRNKYEVDVVIGHTNPDHRKIKEKCKLNQWGFHCEVDYMSKLMLNADMVIGGGGSTSWEKCFLGIPSISVILASNQVEITNLLASHGAVINLGWHDELVTESYSDILNKLDIQILNELSSQASLLVDGKGIDRVIKSIFLISEGKKIWC